MKKSERIKYQKQKFKVVADILETKTEEYHNATLDDREQLFYFFVKKFGIEKLDIKKNGNFNFQLENIPFHIAVELAQFLKRKISNGKIQNRGKSTNKGNTKKANGT